MHPDDNIVRISLVEDALNYSVRRCVQVDPSIPKEQLAYELDGVRREAMSQLAEQVLEASKTSVEVGPSLRYNDLYTVEARLSLTALESKKVARLEQVASDYKHELDTVKSKLQCLYDLPWYKYLWFKFRGLIP